MAEEPNESRLETCIGIVVVLLATFMALCSVKAGTSGKKCNKPRSIEITIGPGIKRRNIRQSVYESTAAELSIPAANETDEARQQREAKAAEYRERATSQEQKMEKQKSDAEAADAEYNTLGAKDDQFDISEAALALGLAMMGVTALLKRWWLFYVALVPSLFGLGMGLAGFAGMSTETAVVKWMIDLLS